MTICVHCGLPLHTALENGETEHHASGRFDTAIGPMHFRCFWAFQKTATNLMMDQPMRRVA